LTSEKQKSIEIGLSENRKFLLNKILLGPIFLIIIFLGILARAITADYYVKQGLIYRGDQRIEFFEKGVSLNPFYSVYKRALANSYLNSATEKIDPETSKITLKNNGQFLTQKALSMSEDAVRTDPYDPVNYTNLSILYFRLSLTDKEYLQKALENAEKAKEIEFNSPEAWDNAGLVLLDIGNREKAKEYFEKAISLKSNYDPSHFHLGETLRQLGRPEEALEHYQMFSGERAEQEIKETLLEIERKQRK
jgi:tetratricopeptide (TPR) repeat protein